MLGERRDINAFLREIAERPSSAKDFRTLCGCLIVTDALNSESPEENRWARRRQILDAICIAAQELGNTPAICRKEL
jgi:DNA topoisomerase-1